MVLQSAILILSPEESKSFPRQLLSSAIFCANQLRAELCLYLLQTRNDDAPLPEIHGCSRIIRVFCDESRLHHEFALEDIIRQIINREQAAFVFTSNASIFQKIMPLCAKNATLLTNICSISVQADNLTCSRYICASRFVETQHLPLAPCFMTLQYQGFGNVLTDISLSKPTIEFFEPEIQASLPKLHSFEAFAEHLFNLQDADLVLAGGRGLQTPENFRLLETLAFKMKAGIAASRMAVDMGFCHNDLQVGQTGKSIAPQLYIAFGISGAIQHIAGIRNARNIIAVNINSEEPIFRYAKYGFIADATQTIRKLLESI